MYTIKHKKEGWTETYEDLYLFVSDFEDELDTEHYGMNVFEIKEGKKRVNLADIWIAISTDRKTDDGYVIGVYTNEAEAMKDVRKGTNKESKAYYKNIVEYIKGEGTEHYAMNTSQEVDAIMERYNLSMRQLSNMFGIPYRTIQNWGGCVNECPDYTIAMMKEILRYRFPNM